MADDEDREEQVWTDALPVCQHSGIGSLQNQGYKADGTRVTYRDSEDLFFHFRTDDANTYLYAIFDGYDGKEVAAFAHQRLPAELLLGQIEGVTDDDQVKQILSQAILIVERSYFETIDGLLAQKTMLSMNLPEGFNMRQTFQHQEEIAQLKEIEEKLKGGTALIVALLHRKKLYVANVGDSRALLCTKEGNGELTVTKVSVDHNIANDDEVLRLEQLGLGTNVFQGEPLIGDSPATRTIGNYRVKGGYRDNPDLRCASKEPVIADPDIVGGIKMDGKVGFLVMFTHGFWQALEAATGTTNIDTDIVNMVAKEFSQQGTLSSVAQAVVDRVVRMHHDAFMSGGQQKELKRREDITVIVRNFDFPLGHTRHIYIPPRHVNVAQEYPVITPIYSPSSGSVNGGSSPSTPLPFDQTPTPNTTPKISRLESSGGVSTNSSEDSDQRPLSGSLGEAEEEEKMIDAYVNFNDLNIALLNTDTAEVYIQ